MAQKIDVILNMIDDKVKKSLDQLRSQTKSLGTDFTNSFKAVALGNLAADAVRTSFRLLGSAVRASFNDLRDFSRGVAEINSLLPGNERLQKKVTNEFLRFSSVFGKDLNTQTKGFYDIVSAGIEGTASQLETLRASNEAAVAGLTTVANAADILTSSVNAYGIENLSATQASDDLFAAVIKGKTTFAELAPTVGRVATFAKQAGLEFSELTGTLAFLTKGGIKTDEAVVGLRNILKKITNPTKEAETAAKNLGLEFGVSAIKGGKFRDFLADLRQKTGGNTEILSKLFGNIRALGPILQIVTGDFKNFNDILDFTEGSAGATARAAAKVKESLDFEVDRLSSSFKVFGVVLLTKLGPALTNTASDLADFFTALSGANDPTALDVLKKKLADESAELMRLNHNLENGKRQGERWARIHKGAITEAAAESTVKIADLRKEIVKLGGSLATISKDEGGDALGKIVEKEKLKTEAVLANEALRAELQTALQTEIDEAVKEADDARDEAAAARRANNAAMVLTAQKKLLDAQVKQAELGAKQKLIKEAQANVALRELDLKFKKQKAKDDATELKRADKVEKEKQKAQIASANAIAGIAGNLNGILIEGTGKRNKALFAIQKAAAIASIFIQTEVAAALVKGQAGLLGFGAEALVRAQGYTSAALVAAQTLTGFADGGMVTGGTPGRDSIPALLQRGEVVSPRQNFEEVIGSVRAKREADKVGSSIGGSGDINLTFGVRDDFIELIEQQIVERQNLGISILKAV